MIVNGVGFVGRALYMTPTFFANTPLSRLDDVAFGIGMEQKLLGKTVHLDSASISMEGSYNEKYPETMKMIFGFAKE